MNFNKNIPQVFCVARAPSPSPTQVPIRVERIPPLIPICVERFPSPFPL